VDLLALSAVSVPSSPTSSGRAEVYTANPTAATSPRKMLPALNVTSLTMGHLPGCLLTSVNVPGDHPFRQADDRR
jgi:fructose-specific phosphotransferase system IIC component